MMMMIQHGTEHVTRLPTKGDQCSTSVAAISAMPSPSTSPLPTSKISIVSRPQPDNIGWTRPPSDHATVTCGLLFIANKQTHIISTHAVQPATRGRVGRGEGTENPHRGQFVVASCFPLTSGERASCRENRQPVSFHVLDDDTGHPARRSCREPLKPDRARPPDPRQRPPLSRRAELGGGEKQKADARDRGCNRRRPRQAPFQRLFRRRVPKVRRRQLHRQALVLRAAVLKRGSPTHAHGEEPIPEDGQHASEGRAEDLGDEYDVCGHVQQPAELLVQQEVCRLHGTGLGDCAGDEVDEEGMAVMVQVCKECKDYLRDLC